ncbi:helix-turn-helix domain-containing protein [Staphylococcus aureus]|uniref:helix-turn-helix domain-containing protein n=1 Tax=Staphylococcus aureus TaxID=1280 RepID=UPI00385459F3
MAKKNTQRKRRVPVDLDTRLAIAKYLDDGLTILQIANILGRHHNVIYYELNHRSQKDGTYDPVKAHKMAKETKKMPEKKETRDACIKSCYKEIY